VESADCRVVGEILLPISVKIECRAGTMAKIAKSRNLYRQQLLKKRGDKQDEKADRCLVVKKAEGYYRGHCLIQSIIDHISVKITLPVSI
jgi:hypothetical protein